MKKLMLLKQPLLALVALGLLPVVHPAFGQSWTQTTAPDANWHAVASSADGTKLFAAAKGGPILISTNSGVTWTPGGGAPLNWFSIASSADGTKLVATSSSGLAIYTSRDFGATWTAATNELYAFYYSCAASSADGNRLVVGSYDGVHHGGWTAYSTDAGATWMVGDGVGTVSVAMSADGSTLLAAAGPSGFGSFWALFGVSTNSGATWTGTGVPSSLGWSAAASSADGTKLIATTADGSGFIYSSKDSGATWVTNVAFTGDCISIASSAGGNKLAAAQGGCFSPGGPLCGGPVYTSTDAGATWVSNSIPDAFAVASSADGNQLVAVMNPGGIWMSRSQPRPMLTINGSATNLLLSWITPSTSLLLQQNADLPSTNWSDVTNTPTLNLTNLHNEVIVPSPNASRFYRLRN